jgi:hypothetical protein
MLRLRNTMPFARPRPAGHFVSSGFTGTAREVGLDRRYAPDEASILAARRYAYEQATEWHRAPPSDRGNSSPLRNQAQP